MRPIYCSAWLYWYEVTSVAQDQLASDESIIIIKLHSLTAWKSELDEAFTIKYLLSTDFFSELT